LGDPQGDLRRSARQGHRAMGRGDGEAGLCPTAWSAGARPACW
jgi:hypothetical protein